jgi:hypothetical protein
MTEPTGFSFSAAYEIFKSDEKALFDSLVERGRRVDHLITDPPYGARTHDGHEAASAQIVDATGQRTRREIVYDCWAPADAIAFVSRWSMIVDGWFCVMTSHDLVPAIENEFEKVGRYVFAPVGIVEKTPRLLGDGPASWLRYMVVSRPRDRAWLDVHGRCLPGVYGPGPREQKPVIGGKPVWLMRALARDYSEPGDLICDPCMGGGTTGIGALTEGRRFIGAEPDAERFEIASKRLQAPTQRGLF